MLVRRVRRSLVISNSHQRLTIRSDVRIARLLLVEPAGMSPIISTGQLHVVVKGTRGRISLVTEAPWIRGVIAIIFISPLARAKRKIPLVIGATQRKRMIIAIIRRCNVLKPLSHTKHTLPGGGCCTGTRWWKTATRISHWRKLPLYW